MSQCPRFSMDFGFHAIYRKVKHKKSTTGVFAVLNLLYSSEDNKYSGRMIRVLNAMALLWWEWVDGGCG